MFRIKICGVTSVADAQAAAAAGADAIGLNFFAASRRYLTPQAADEIAASIPPGIAKVGVFVNAAAEFVCRTSDRLRLDLIQLAGNETPQSMCELDNRPVMKVLRPRLESAADFSATVVDFLCEADKLGCTPKLLLIDAYQAREFGGTGRTVDWARLSDWWERECVIAPPLVLAGGLTPDNILEAIKIVRPAAVDVASGVESAIGVKDPDRMQQFVSVALAGLRNYPPGSETIRADCPPAASPQPPTSRFNH